jgi:hypothetical protein
MTTETDGWGLGVALDSAGKWVAYRGNAGCFRLTRLTDFVEVDATVKNYTAISPSGQDFAGGGWFLPGRDGVDRRIPLPIDEHPNAMVSAFTPDGKRLVAGTEQGVVLLVDIKEVQRRLAGFR